MAELRQNIATHEWVIIAGGRAERPTVYAEAGRQPTVDRATWEPGCAFCPGNEEDALEVSRSPGERWRTRLVRNKFPALAVDGALLRRYEGVERRLSGVGYHEVLVAHRHHDTTLALMTAGEVRNVLLALQKRGRELAQDERVEYLVYFKNHGPPRGRVSGASALPADLAAGSARRGAPPVGDGYPLF
jgi:UDPglucose--hexose-1-phosphate uridylyltransferase